MQYNSRLFISLLSLTPILFLLPKQSYAMDVVEELKTCARIADQKSRSACYEELGKKVLDEPAIDEVAANPVTSNSLPDSIGGGDFADRAGVLRKSYRGRITSCKRASDNKWFYVFDNGQVWKQVDNRKRYYKECDFEVTVAKDSIGYIMQVDGDKRKTRIDRRK